MRFLLLLSALFTALAGVAGPRAQAQPVQASASTIAPVAAAVAQVPAAVRIAGAGWPRLVLAQPPLPRIVGAVAARLLYAERRRE